MYEAYVHLPNVPYPQKASFYAELPNQVPQPGTYECDVIADVRDGRLTFDVDPRQARRVSSSSTQASAPKAG
ncbi:propanediol utilization protein [Pseudomonas lactis]